MMTREELEKVIDEIKVDSDYPWMHKLDYILQNDQAQRTEIEQLTEQLRLANIDWINTEKENQALREALRELYAVVQGECPRLLNEDSGGDAGLCVKIEQAPKEAS